MVWLHLMPQRSVACESGQRNACHRTTRRADRVLRTDTAKDRRAGRKALGRLGWLVDDIVTRSGLDEDELVQEISPKGRPR